MIAGATRGLELRHGQQKISDVMGGKGKKIRAKYFRLICMFYGSTVVVKKVLRFLRVINC